MTEQIAAARKALEIADIARAAALDTLNAAKAAAGQEQAIANAKAFTERAALNRAAGLARGAEMVTSGRAVAAPSVEDLGLIAARENLIKAKAAKEAANSEWSAAIEAERLAARATADAKSKHSLAAAPVNRARAVLSELERTRNVAKHVQRPSAQES